MPSDFAIRHAAHIIRHGGVIAYPTDTIYGLGCDPWNQEAVNRINSIKQRPLNKQFILLAGDIAQLKHLIEITREQQQIIIQNTEPTSWIVPASTDAPCWLTGNDGSLSIRVTDHPDVQRLCRATGYAIISTSANISGKAPAKSAFELHKYFHHKVDKILLADKPPAGKASKIIRLCDNVVIRQ